MTLQPTINYEARALSRLADDERQAEAEDQRRRSEIEARAWERVREQEAAAEAVAVKQLAALRPLYDKRDEAARVLADALDSFWGVERELVRGLRAVTLGQPLGPTEVAVASLARSRLERLRIAAGLSPRHGDLPTGDESTGWRLLHTLYVAVRSGSLGLGHFRGPSA